MPPANVPHSDPALPIITASNAKMSWVGPLDGVMLEWMARNAPASVAVPTAIAVARAYTVEVHFTLEVL